MPGEMEEREGIEYICKLIYEAYRVPVMWLDAADTPRATLPPAFECRQAVQGLNPCFKRSWILPAGAVLRQQLPGRPPARLLRRICIPPASWRISSFSSCLKQIAPVGPSSSVRC